MIATLAESATLERPSTEGPKGIWRSRLIQADVQGSSGFYPADVLMRDGARSFPAGTHVYFDHPTSSEDNERPERSVRDLAGYLVDPAHYEEGPDGRGLFARIQFTETAKNYIRDLVSVIGLSIRAAGEIEVTERGRIVRSIQEGLSVDLVTRAGAGGRLVNMTESAKPESPPDTSTGTTQMATAPSNAIPSTTGTGALLSEVQSMKDTFADRLDQVGVEVARMAQRLHESQRAMEKQTLENQKLADALVFLRDRQEAVDKKIKESEGVGKTTADLLKSGLPLSSMVRVAEAHRADQDIHEKIQQEREYGKRLMRESERSGLEARDSGLGLTESASNLFSAATSDSSVSDENLHEIEAVLSGKMF